jgi:beta-glucosidase
MTYEFPSSFLWGAATSAYQIEGSPTADGAGPSIWHRFVKTPGLTKDGDTGDVACDHYRRMEDDVAMMKRLGLTAYRFSIAWGRVLPEGRAPVNEAGLGFYERLVDTLLAHGIQPMATLYHWDLPAALDDRGGWLNPDIADWFADYASVMIRRLDDRVKLWATLNEPWVVTDGGYLTGALAPGHKNRFEAPIASHHLLRAHGKAVQAYRALGKHQVGLVVNIEPKYPASQAPQDLAATRRAEAYMNRQYLDPVFKGRYPEEMREIFGEAWPEWPQQDHALIRQPIDFLGRQLLHPQRRPPRRDGVSAEVRSGAAEAGRLQRDRLGGLPARPHRHAGLDQAAVRRHSAVRHRERRGVLRSAGRARPAASTTHCASTTTAPTCVPCTMRSARAWTSAAIARGR